MGDSTTETAILGGGCFWCLEAVFLELKGVRRVTSGYMGGATQNPTYRDVCSGTTGHAEVISVEFDRGEIDFRSLLEVFFAIHDPTTSNRQGNDIGTQYRSVIFYTSPKQKRVAEEVIAALEAAHAYASPIVTELAPAGTFYTAEDYHQDYYINNAYQPYCQFVVEPKLRKFREKFKDKALPAREPLG